jgi:hypothetical protein
MKNLELIEKAFGAKFDRSRSDFGLGPVPSEADVLVRRLLYTGGLERVKYPFSLREHLEPRPKCLFDLACILALTGDTHLVEVCETGERLERIRLSKERDLKMIRDERIQELRQDGLEGDLVVAVVGRYDRAQRALSIALRTEELAFIERWRPRDWAEPSREAEIGRLWEAYFGAENALKESLYSKVLRLGWKTRG